MKHLILLSILFLTACGSAVPTASEIAAADSSTVSLAPTTYIYRVSGAGVTFAASLYNNFGSASQLETPVATNTIPDSSAIDYTVYGTDTVADFANHSGGLLTVEALRNGVSVETKTALPGFSIHFNIDI